MYAVLNGIRVGEMGTHETVVQGTFYFPEKGTKQNLVDNFTGAGGKKVFFLKLTETQ
jgi:hypothetical protein